MWAEREAVGIDILGDRRETLAGEFSVLKPDPDPPAGIVGGLDRDAVMVLPVAVTVRCKPVLEIAKDMFGHLGFVAAGVGEVHSRL